MNKDMNMFKQLIETNNYTDKLVNMEYVTEYVEIILNN
jgi:hypothetical protein